MKAVLQHRGSGRYRKSQDGWTARLEKAADFKDFFQAVRHVNTRRLACVDLLVHFNNPKYNTRVRLSA